MGFCTYHQMDGIFILRWIWVWPLGSRLWCLIVFLSLFHVVSWVRCGTWLYRFLIFATFYYFEDSFHLRKQCVAFCSILSGSSLTAKVLANRFRVVCKWVKIILTHLCLMEFPTFIDWTNPFRIKRLLDSRFKFHSNFISSFCKQTVKNLIRCHVLRHLI